jgi:hypothetical protein
MHAQELPKREIRIEGNVNLKTDEIIWLTQPANV